MSDVFHDPLGDDQHDRFQQWRSAHPRGFVINCKTKTKGKLHHADCPHMGDFKWESDEGYGLAKYKKVCALDRDELSRWAEVQRMGIEICNDCMRD